MKYLILMTIAGSALFVCWWCWQKLFGAFLNQGMKYRALVVVLLVYVVPWAWLKGIYGFAIRGLLRTKVSVISGHAVALADIMTDEEAYRTPDYRWLLLIVGIWTVVALALMIYKAASYFHNKRKLLLVGLECEDDSLEETVERLREKLHYHGRLEIYVVPGMNTTFTLGLIRPVIFLQSEYFEGQLPFIIEHELTHIARKDLLVKLLLEVVCCLHWFNVLIYFFKDRLVSMCEASCDERVLAGRPEEEQKAYSRLLIDNLKKLQEEQKRRKAIPFGSGLNDAYDMTKERVNLIMKARDVKNWKKKVATGAFALLLMANSLTALAYPDVYHVETEGREVAEEVGNGNAFWTGGFEEEGYNELLFDIVYNEEFIDEQGNVSPVYSYSPYVFCFKHDIVSGYLQTHVEDDKGGCTVKAYESTKCLNCNTIWVGDLVATYIYVKCPH